MLFALAACAVILSEDEKDFLILGHIQLMKVFMFRFIASVLSVTAVPMAIIILFTKERRPIKAALAFAVTVLLIAAIGAFFRVVLKSTLASMIFSLIVFTLLLFSTELGMFSPFGSMSIANMEKFYWNRGIWFGVAAVLMAQTMENVGMCLAILPTVGITLPFLSCGGSSLLATFMLVGMVHSVKSHRPAIRY